MRIGVDGSVYSAVTGGVARYLDCMVSEMASLEPEAEFVFYTPRPAKVALPTDKCRVRAGSGLRSVFVNLWIQEQVPIWAAEDRLDVFWGQNNELPLRLRRPCFRLLTVHDLVPLVCPDTLPLRSALARRFYLAKACRVADAVLAVSDATVASLLRLVGVKPQKIRRVYEGVDENIRPVPKALARQMMAAKYGLTEDYLLTIGTIEPRKGHETLMRALRSVPSAPILAMVGAAGWKSRRIVEEIAAMEKVGRVRWLGWVEDSDLPALYSAAEAMVFPSLYEGFGLPVLEAMACGCPVLCSWSSSLPELGGDAALYFRTGDSSDLARTLAGVLSDQNRRAVMSATGLARVRHFSFRRAATEVLDIIRRGTSRPCQEAGQATPGVVDPRESWRIAS